MIEKKGFNINKTNSLMTFILKLLQSTYLKKIVFLFEFEVFKKYINLVARIAYDKLTKSLEKQLHFCGNNISIVFI
ncbi:hypothetical protein EGI26_09970 [Lacihabitans sp. CCS-44]|nr:hypothetical protein [Lacihabitans sp. CCS-44]